MIYNDNEFHFKNFFIAKLIEQDVKHFFVFVNHSSFVKLMKKYVRLILKIFKIILQHYSQMIFEWDLLLSVVIKAINTRMIRAFNYSSIELLLDFQLKYTAKSDVYETVLRTKIIENRMKIIFERLIVNQIMIIENRNFEERLTQLNEMRYLVLNKRLSINKNMTFKIFIDHFSSTTDNLIRLRKLTQTSQKSHKLKPRWENLYRVARINKNNKSL